MSYFQCFVTPNSIGEMEKNLALFANRGFNYIRVLSMVSWDGLEIMPVTFTNRQGAVEAWPDYWDSFATCWTSRPSRIAGGGDIFADAQIVMPCGRAAVAPGWGPEEHRRPRTAAPASGSGQRSLAKRFSGQGSSSRSATRTHAAPDGPDRRAGGHHVERRHERAGDRRLYRGSAADLATVHFSREPDARRRLAAGSRRFAPAISPGVPPSSATSQSGRDRPSPKSDPLQVVFRCRGVRTSPICRPMSITPARACLVTPAVARPKEKRRPSNRLRASMPFLSRVAYCPRTYRTGNATTDWNRGADGFLPE